MAETSQSGPGNMHSLVSVLGAVFASKGYPFKNIFVFFRGQMFEMKVMLGKTALFQDMTRDLDFNP